MNPSGLKPAQTRPEGITALNCGLNRLPAMQPLASGTLELMKWIAVLLMTADHINLHLLGAKYPVMFAMGRVALPMFVFVLAYNLAQLPARNSGAALRVLERLLPVAVIASLPYMELNLEAYGWRPLNVLFTLAAGTGVVALLEQPTWRRQIFAMLLFAGSGAVVDYGWTGLGLFVSLWHLFRSPKCSWALSSAIFLVLLGSLNGNQWALAAVPVIGLGFGLRPNLPRFKNALYYYYPLHLFILAVLKIAVFDR
jgi:hypothetical protein